MPNESDKRDLASDGGRGGGAGAWRRVETMTGGNHIATLQGDGRLKSIEDTHHALAAVPLAPNRTDTGGEIGRKGEAAPRGRKGPGGDECGLTGPQN